jgi:ABC-2 type transport system ATP-binding protein
VPPAIRLRGVSKVFGRRAAVSGLDLEVSPGEVLGFIGPNGAGKTTTIRMILGILGPDAGSIEVLGERDPTRAQGRIGYLPEERGLYRRMRVTAFLTYLARLRGVSSRGLEGEIRRRLEALGIGAAADKRCEELSKGMQQKVQIVGATLHDPALLILDEPFSGLDPVSRRQLRATIQDEQRREKTILFSTHAMHDAESLCDRVVMVSRGRKVLDARVDEALAPEGSRVIAVEPAGAAEADLAALPMVERVIAADRSLLVHLRDGADPPAAIRAIVAAMPVRRVELVRPTLEDLFVHLAGEPPPSVLGDEVAS